MCDLTTCTMRHKPKEMRPITFVGYDDSFAGKKSRMKKKCSKNPYFFIFANTAFTKGTTNIKAVQVSKCTLCYTSNVIQ